jgi:GNAT superfamily N-acetyltransferase
MANKYPFSKIGDAKLEFISMSSDKNWDQYKDSIIEMKKAMNKEYKGKMIDDSSKDPKAVRSFHRPSMVIKIDNQEVGIINLKQGEFVNLITEKSYGNNKVDYKQSTAYYALYNQATHYLNDVEDDTRDAGEEKTMKRVVDTLDTLAALRYLSDRMVLLDTLYVKPEYRGYGVATRVYQKLFSENWCAGVYVSNAHYHKYDWTKYCDSFSLTIGQMGDPEKMMLTLWDSNKVPSYKGQKLNDKQLLNAILHQQKMMWKNESLFNVFKKSHWLAHTLDKLAKKYNATKVQQIAGMLNNIISPVQALEGFRLYVNHTPQVAHHSLPTDDELDMMTTNSWTRQKGSQLWDSEKSWALTHVSYQAVLDVKEDLYKQIAKASQSIKQTQTA